MKLATYADGTRDGHLVVVSRDLACAVYANTQASRLQHLLDDWNFVAPQLHELSITLNHGKARHSFVFDPALCMAPLPRLGSWAWQPLGAQTDPATLAADTGRAGWTRPLLHGDAGDDMRGPGAELALPAARWPGQVHAGLAVVTGELALQAGPTQALEAVRLLGLYSRWTLADSDSEASGGSGGGGGGAAPGALAPHWAPLLVTPDELGDAWSAGRVDLALQLQWLSACGLPLGEPCLARGGTQRWHYGQLLAWACRLRRLRAGAGLGCDWLSAGLPRRQDLAPPPAPAAAPARTPRRSAAAATAAARATAEITSGPAYGARLEVLGPDGQSIFGTLSPTWAQAEEPADLAHGSGAAKAGRTIDAA